MDLRSFKDDELISLRAEVEREMRSRGIRFSVGEIGEALAIKYFNSTPGLSNLKDTSAGTKNVDAVSRDGDRYSIKTIQKAKKTGTVYPDDRDRDRQLFEYLLIVKLAPDFSLEALYRFSWIQFLKVRAWDKRMNAWYVPVSGNRLGQGTCLFCQPETNKVPGENV
ncbi:MAG: hypothetical protein ABSB41_02170 [Anaerolineales bacterium]|jgi:hypothetical protein